MSNIIITIVEMMGKGIRKVMPKSCRSGLDALKKRGLSGEELRRIMWGRASISSPTKEPKKKPIRDPNEPYGALFGGAIGTAVDVMSFIHYIVMCSEILVIVPTNTQSNSTVTQDKSTLIRYAKSAVSRTGTEQTNDRHPLFHVACEEKARTQVKNHMEMFHLRKGIPPVRLNRKYEKGRRPKTARDKVSPTEDEIADRKQRRGRSVS